MAELGPFISTSDGHLRVAQICSMLRGTYNYRAINCSQPFTTDNNLIFDEQCLSRPVSGTAIIESHFPTMEFTQLLLTTRMELFRRVCDDEQEEHVTQTERLLIRVDSRSQFSLWNYQSQDQQRDEQDGNLQHLGCCGWKTTPIYGQGKWAHQRFTLTLNRPTHKYGVLDPYFVWDVLQITLYIGPGIENSIAGKKTGFEIAWAEHKSTRLFFNQVQDEYVEARMERYEPADEETKAKWMGSSDLDWNQIAPKALPSPQSTVQPDTVMRDSDGKTGGAKVVSLPK